MNLISFATDGANVILEKKSGIAEKLSKMYPEIIVWHYMNYSDTTDDKSFSDFYGQNTLHL